MNLYAFQLGRKKELCLAELIEVFGKENLVEKNFDTAIFKLDITDAQNLQDNLGGTIKIIEIFDLIDKSGESINTKIQSSVKTQLKKTFENRSGKIPFSVSLHNFKRSPKINIKKLLNFSKKFLKSLGLNSRFVNKNFHSSPPPSTIYKAKVVEKGIDICLINGEKGIFTGKTVAIQNIDNYSLRDYKKPKRDARVGMLPPKLAQIMINLAGNNTQTLYDPFCGTGTILMEGLLMGKNCYGSDIDSRMVNYTNVNCEWVKNLFNTQGLWEAFELKAQKMNKKIIPKNLDAIITEGYLGKPQSKTPTEKFIKETFQEIKDIHQPWLQKIHPITKKSLKIVLCIPAFRTEKGLQHMLEFPEIAQKSKFNIINRFTYDRPEQIVARDIFIMTKI